MTVNACTPAWCAPRWVTTAARCGAPAGGCCTSPTARSRFRPTQGAEAIAHLATAPELDGVTGRYFVGREPAESSPASRDPAAAGRLWALSEELTCARSTSG